MSVQVQNLSKLEKKVSITVSTEDVQKEFAHAYEDAQKTAEVKGFRKGKVPMNMVKSLFKDKVYSHVVQHLVEDHFWKAVEDNSLNPINQPELKIDGELKEDGPFSFSLTFEVHPDVELKKYKGLSVQKEKLLLDPNHVDSTLNNILKSRASQIDVLEDRPAQKGDIAVIDFDGKINNEPLEGGRGENQNLELGSNTFITGFEDAIVGMRIGGTTTAQLKFPENYHVTSLAGLPVEFKITLKGLKKNQLPDLNDEFAVQLGFKNIEDLKTAISEDYKRTEEKRIQEDFKNRLLKELAKQNSFDVPKSLLERQKKVLIEDMAQRMGSGSGLSDKDFSEYAQKWDKDFTETAEFIVQSSYLVNKIAEVENLKAAEKDINDKIDFYIKQTGIEEQKVRSIYDSPENRSRLRNMITEEKVIDYLTQSAEILEVAKEKLS